MQQDAAYDQAAEDQARQWIEAITEEPVGGSDFFDGLRDGSHLCRSATVYLAQLAYRPAIIDAFFDAFSAD